MLSIVSPFVTVLVISIRPVLSANCYYPNGNVIASHTPCNASADVSACCGPGDVCLSNGYCFQQAGVWANRIARGACTDKTWESAECPYYCSDVQAFTGVSLFLAFEVVSTTTSGFCCGQNYNASTGECELQTHGSFQPFSLPVGNAIYDRSDGSTVNPVKTNNASTSNTTAGSADATPAPSSNGQSTTTTVAIGIAVPLGVLLILTTTTTIVFWKKYNKIRTQNAKQMSCYSPGAGTFNTVTSQGPHPAQSSHIAHLVHAAQSLGSWVGPHELGDDAVNEVPGSSTYAEKGDK